MDALICPKDQAVMRSIERNGVTIERCTECGGVFLDRGELERLIDAEGRYAGRRDPDEPGGDGGSGKPKHGPAQRRKRRGFLEDFLDFG